MARVVFSQATKDDLLEIWLSLAANNMSAAERLLADLYAATRVLAVHYATFVPFHRDAEAVSRLTQQIGA